MCIVAPSAINFRQTDEKEERKKKNKAGKTAALIDTIAEKQAPIRHNSNEKKRRKKT